MVVLTSPPPPTTTPVAAAVTFLHHHHHRLTFLPTLNPQFHPPPRVTITTRLHPTRVHHALPTSLTSDHVSVFVTLPSNAVGSTGQLVRSKTMGASMMALAAAGVEGVAIEVWWGVVEKDGPGRYDWGGYVDLVQLAARFGMKVRIVLGFHQRGSGPGDPCWLPLPRLVHEEIDRYPDLAYSDRFGRRNREYVSLGCDILPILRGRSPVQVYSDFMRSFRDTFEHVLGVIITEVQVGMGPCGELRYPSRPSEKFMRPRSVPELGEFQCYDKYMLASLNAAAQEIGMRQWGNGGPLGAGSLFQNPEETSFFRSDGSWDTDYGHFFLQWYSEMLLLHGERLCMAAETIFSGTCVRLLAKLAGIYWHYRTDSHPSELTAGYYNTRTRDGYLPIAQMLARYKMTLSCSCFDLKDSEEEEINPRSSPEGFLRRLVNAARICNIPFCGENSQNRLDDSSFRQIIRNSKHYSDGIHGSPLSFNFVRMSKHLFDSHNWMRFTRFVRQMSDVRTFQARLDHGMSTGEELWTSSCTSLTDFASSLCEILPFFTCSLFPFFLFQMLFTHL